MKLQFNLVLFLTKRDKGKGLVVSLTRCSSVLKPAVREWSYDA
jgi:hypothetical protein